jgi:hypothetical protein
VRIEQVGDAGAGDHDAGVPVPGGQDAELSGFEVEAGGVAAPRQGVDDDGDGELCALQPVGGVDPDLAGGGRRGEGEGLADLVGLVAVRDADSDVAGAERLSVGVALAGPDGAAGDVPGGSCRAQPDRAAISRVASCWLRIPAVVKFSCRTPGSVAAQNPVNG